MAGSVMYRVNAAQDSFVPFFGSHHTASSCRLEIWNKFGPGAERVLSSILSGCQAVPLWDYGAETSACEEQEPGVQGHWLRSESLQSCGSVSHADVFSCYKPSHLKDQRWLLWQSLAGSVLFQTGKARDVHGKWWVLGSTCLVPGAWLAGF